MRWKTLQGRGHKVGVITHLPAMIERIAVQVRVEKCGPGRSEIRVSIIVMGTVCSRCRAADAGAVDGIIRKRRGGLGPREWAMTSAKRSTSPLERWRPIAENRACANVLVVSAQKRPRLPARPMPRALSRGWDGTR